MKKNIKKLEKLKKNQSAEKVIEIEVLEKEADEIKNVLTTESKKQVMIRLSKFWGRAQKTGLEVIKEIFVSVTAEIANVLANAGIGIAGMHSPNDPENPDKDFVDMVFRLHTCAFGKLKATLKKTMELESVNSAPVVFRIENLSS